MVSRMTGTIIVKAGITDVFNIWANFESFPAFMPNVKAVKKIGPKASHWIVEGPFGRELEWDAQETEMEPPKRMAWKSFNGNIKTSGEVTFNDLNNEETQVTVVLQYVPPAGWAGDMASHVLDAPEPKFQEALRRFKEYAESTATPSVSGISAARAV